MPSERCSIEEQSTEYCGCVVRGDLRHYKRSLKKAMLVRLG
jgi:hypothetical protein